jgi:putative DNA-invertase from lambdoid prophage Rac
MATGQLPFRGESSGVIFHCILERAPVPPVRLTLPAGRLTFQVLGAVAEFEREMLRERVKAGMAQAKRSGKHVGRPEYPRSTGFGLKPALSA